MKLLALLLFCLLVSSAFALGGNPNVIFSAKAGAFPLVLKGRVAQVKVDSGDWPGVARAGRDLQSDLLRVSNGGKVGGAPILAGTLGRSPTIDGLVRARKINVDAIRGKWEASVTQVVEIPGRGRCLVVAGSDKRGTIYGLYDLSESVGVSPWNWWADVPVKTHPAVFVTGRYLAKSPVVKYRGIFLNDEAPALSNWVHANFGDYNHKFYEKIFELLLRLRANYLWPAMWNNRFSEDDPLNPKLADEYGIVMGTSHVEPMMRADKEWNRLGFTEKQWNYATNPQELEKFWTDGVNRNKPYENIVTMAMRGKIDTPMSETANIALLEKIVAAQRKILAENVNPDVTQIPQLWCLYKEVQEYYEKGMRVPDDVTLLWADDNWGNIRRLPTPEERKRSGGAGVYYHFDYVGGPRNYKWINTNPIPKIWEQMNLAHHYGADRIWIVNVGDLKPMEFPLEFFLTMARDPEAMKKEELGAYTRHWAAREFGKEHADEIADIIGETDRINGRRKPELLSPETYSLFNYIEAWRAEEFGGLFDRAKDVKGHLWAEYDSAFEQLVFHPIKAAMTVNKLYIAAAKNALYAQQGRAGTNNQAAEVRRLFAEDQKLTSEYHALNGGKWNHFMDQTHIGYTGWQQPDSNVMPKVVEIPVPNEAELGITQPGTSETWPRAGSIPQLVIDRNSARWSDDGPLFQIFNRGRTPFPISFRTTDSRIKAGLWDVVSQIEDSEWAVIQVDWSKLPSGTTKAVVTIAGAGSEVKIEVLALNRQAKGKGFVEGDGVVAIEAENSSRRIGANGVRWETIPDYGRTLSGVEPFPVEFKPFEPGKGARMEYDLTTFTGGKATLEAVVGPSLAFHPGHGLRVAFAFDDQTPQVVDIAANYLSHEWEEAVSDSARKLRTQHDLKPGKHVLKVWAIDPGVVIERLVLDLGGLKPSYLGPPESRRLPERP